MQILRILALLVGVATSAVAQTDRVHIGPTAPTNANGTGPITIGSVWFDTANSQLKRLADLEPETWEVLAPGAAGAVAWNDITGKPATFAPSSHSHAIGDTTNLQTTLDGKLATNGNGSGLTNLTKSQVGLGNVENTALSTWAGSTSITTLGMISGGTVPWANVSKTSSSLADLVTRSASDLSSGTLPDARFPSTLPAISGANLTSLDASDLASGTIPDARFPATLPSASGVNLTSLDASDLASGTVPDARLSANVMQTTFAGALASDVSTGANTTPVNATGLLFSYAANSTYLIEVVGSISAAAATTGVGLQFDLSSAVTSINFAFFHVLANTGTLTGGNSIADDASAAVSSGISANGAIVPFSGTGVLRTTGNTGTAQLRLRSEVAAVSTLKAHTVMRVQKVQ